MKVHLEDRDSSDFYYDYLWNLGYNLAIEHFSDLIGLSYDDAFNKIKKDFIEKELDSEQNKYLLDGFRVGYEQERINLNNFQTIQRLKSMISAEEETSERIRSGYTKLLGDLMKFSQEISELRLFVSNIYKSLLRISFHFGGFFHRKKTKKELEELIEDIKNKSGY
jgi:hypothetical protein